MADIQAARRRMQDMRDIINETREDREAKAVKELLDRDFPYGGDNWAVMEEVLSDDIHDVQGSLSRAIENTKKQLADLTGAEEKADYIREKQKNGSLDVGLITYVGDSGQYESRRVSGNEGWYSVFWKKYKKAPTIRDAYEVAYEETMEEIRSSDDPEAEAMGKEIEALHTKLETLEGLTEYVKKIDQEDLITKTQMSEEAYNSIYVPAVQALAQGNPNVVKAAKDSALLYAKMADAMHEAYQIPYEDIARIQMGGQPGDGYNMPVNRGVKADTLVNVVDLSPYVPKRIIDRKDMVSYVRKTIGPNFIEESADGKVIAIIDTSSRNADHLVNSKDFAELNKPKNADIKKIRQGALLNLGELVRNAVLIESEPNRKANKKPTIARYHNLYVPVNIHGENYTVKITTEEKKTKGKKIPAEVNVYDIFVYKTKGHSSASGVKPPVKSVPHVITIQDMLTDVKDEQGHSFINKDGTLSQGINFSVNNKTYNQMAGERAQNAPLEKLAEAKAMWYDFESDEDIYKKTGWIRRDDGKWRWEIPDNLDKVNLKPVMEARPSTSIVRQYLENVYDNPKLYEAYPDLRHVIVAKIDQYNRFFDTANGYVDAGGDIIRLNPKLMEKDPEKAKTTLMHEIQHMIQDREGFAIGGAPGSVRKQMVDEINRIDAYIASVPHAKEWLSAIGRNDMSAAETLKKEIPQEQQTRLIDENNQKKGIQWWLKQLETGEITERWAYQNLHGEIEARDTASRADRHTRQKTKEKEEEAARAGLEKKMQELPEDLRKAVEADIKANNPEGMMDEDAYSNLPKDVQDAYNTYVEARYNLSMERETEIPDSFAHDGSPIVIFGNLEMPYSMGSVEQNTFYRPQTYMQPMFDVRRAGITTITAFHNRIKAGDRKVPKEKVNSKKWTNSYGVVYPEERIRHLVNEHHLSDAEMEDIDSHINELQQVGKSSWKFGDYKGQYNGQVILARVDGDLKSYIVALEIDENGTVYLGTAYPVGKEKINKKIKDESAGMLLPEEAERSASSKTAQPSTSRSSFISIHRLREMIVGVKYNQSSVVYAGQYSETENLIRVFDGGNMSTVVHESAHFWLSTMERLIREMAKQRGIEGSMDEILAALHDRKDVPARLVKDMETIRAWAKYSPEHLAEYGGTVLEKEFGKHAQAVLAGEEGAEERFIQERFARGFEQYLMTGRAPSKDLKGAFRRFKAWLTDLYGTVKNLGARPPKEVSRIFDKMVATNEEINSWAAERRLSRMDTKLDYSKTEKEQIEAWAEEVKEKAREKCLADFMEKTKAEALAGLEETIGEMREEWKRQIVAENPLYQMEVTKSLQLKKADWLAYLESQGFDENTFAEALQKAGGKPLWTLQADHHGVCERSAHLPCGHRYSVKIRRFMEIEEYNDGE